MRNLLRELHTPLSFATLVYCDNVGAVYLSSNPVQHQRIKHLEIDIHFVGDLVAAGQVRVLYVPSRYQYADIFTKRLPNILFEEFRASLSVRLRDMDSPIDESDLGSLSHRRTSLEVEREGNKKGSPSLCLLLTAFLIHPVLRRLQIQL
ncbi:ribonuclease H-like domain-containing protein [Tanacetum coccineum]